MEKQHLRHLKAQKTQNDKVKPVDSSHIETANLAVHLLNVGWRVAMPFLVFVFGGIFLDSELETSPLYTMIGLVISVVLISRIVYLYVEKYFPGTFKVK